MQKYEGHTMGTYWRVTIAEQVDERQVPVIFSAIEMVLAMINQRMSTYIPDSEIERFGDYQGTDPRPVSPEMYMVVEKALQICRQTDGIYDITVAPLVNMWGFGPKTVNHYPTEEEIAQIKQQIDYKKLTLSEGMLAKAEPNLRLDLCSIAKGYGVDKVADLLESLGYHNYLVDIGGETKISGSKYGNNWSIGIERPQSGGGAIEQIISLKDVKLAIATSGNYRNYSYSDGKYATHEINTKTGYSKISLLLSATVLAEDCMSADGYATALMLYGDKQALSFAEKYSIPALLMVADENAPDRCRLQTSTAFAELFEGAS